MGNSSGGGDGSGWGAATTGGAATDRATPMEEDEVSMESDGRGSDGAGGSGDRLAAKVAEIDMDAVTERVTSEQSAARKTPFKGGETGVKKKDTGKKKRGFARNKAGPSRR